MKFLLFFPMVWAPYVSFLLVFSNVLGSGCALFDGFSNVSVLWKPKTLGKQIKTIKTMIFKLSPDGGVARGDSLKIMVFMVFIVFFPMFWAPCVSFLLVFPMFWIPDVAFLLFFSNVLGFLCAALLFSPMLWVSYVLLLWVLQCSEIFRVSRPGDCIGEHGRGLAESTI